jgi:RimJ/RimL family protein N-acetyltransferase
MIAQSESLSPACCFFSTVKQTPGILYNRVMPCGRVFTIRSLQLDIDLALIHQWVHAPEAVAYWQLDEPAARIHALYTGILDSLFAHSFIGCVDGMPVCQADVYDPEKDPVGLCYPASAGDIGIHLLMGNRIHNIPDLSARIVEIFTCWFFEQPGIRVVIAEPDHRNRAATLLLRRLQFEFSGYIELPGKTACLFRLSKARFYEKKCLKN